MTSLQKQRTFLFIAMESPGYVTLERISNVFPKRKTYNNEPIYLGSVPNKSIEYLLDNIRGLELAEESTIAYDVINKMSDELDIDRRFVTPNHLKKKDPNELATAIENTDGLMEHLVTNFSNIEELRPILESCPNIKFKEQLLENDLAEFEAVIESYQKHLQLDINDMSGGNTIQSVLNTLDGNVLRYSPSKYRKDLKLTSDESRVEALEHMGYMTINQKTSDDMSSVFYAINPNGLSIVVEDGNQDIRLLELVKEGELVSSLENFKTHDTLSETLVLKKPKNIGKKVD